MAHGQLGRGEPESAHGCLVALGIVVLAALVSGGVLIWFVARMSNGLGRALDGVGEVATEVVTSVGPGLGEASEHRAVQVAPAVDLVDGQVVAVASDAFGDATIVGVTVCLREVADGRRGVVGCDLNQFATYAVPNDGAVTVPYDVPRVVTVEDEAIDCAARAGRCVLLLADMEDYDRSGFRSLTYAPDDLGAPAPSLVPTTGPRRSGGLPITPDRSGPLPAGDDVVVRARGFLPGEPLQVSVCSSSFPTERVASTACRDLHDLNWYLGRHFGPTVDLDLATADLRAGPDGSIEVAVLVRSAFRPFGPGEADERDRNADEVDCTAEVGRCSIVVAAAADATRAAVLPYEVAEA